ncbi:hypothetical protein L596_011512 [Steinernema carpocapsae]|uniref:N-alpha-acetyltransferase 20 n=1 Tax=Steinernema carpocapsae TaxID=34508 RepID=A0A4V6A4K4_STECR|nr:hypothetical protein L596_011512 [Steinernema carpocapsae]
MTTCRDFDVRDMFKFNNVNLDPLTETYGFNFYLQYFLNWPEYFQVCEHYTGQIMGYIMGKAEGRDESFHGHVTALTVAPQYRRLSLAARMMRFLEDVSESKKCKFVDLFVRVSNDVACSLYKKLGYVIYRRITNYYSGSSVSGQSEEDAFDMHKALSSDPQKKSEIPIPNPVSCNDIEFN